MAINQLRYYLGPLGYLQPLPPMLGGANFPEAPIHIPSALHTSLSGRTTQDRMGVPKRAWSLVWENLTEADRLLVDAAIYGSSGQPLRLIDPRSTNRLPADVSTGGGLSLGTTAFGSSAAVTDAMGTAVSNGWGNADTGQAWSVVGTASDYSKASGVGKHLHSAANVNHWSTVAAPLADFNQTWTVSTDKLAAGSSMFAYMVGRFVDTSNAYFARLEFTTAATVILTITKLVAGVTTVLATATATLPHTINTKYAVRFTVAGNLLQARMWLASGSEPSTWGASTVDTTFAAAGPAGMRSLVGSGATNAPVNFSFDDFSLTGNPPLSYLPGSVPSALAGILAGAQTWSGLFLGTQLAATSEKMPILAGSTYLFSAYVAGTAQFKLMARPFDVAGAEQTLASGSTQTATGTYQRFSWTWTPSAGQVSAYFGLVAQGTGNIQTTGWHVGIDRPALDAWSFGVGCPAVVVDADIPASYWRAKFHRLRVTLREV